jgi:hypothetical protein
MITVVNQEEADRDVPRLLALKAKLDIPWVGLSIEPMLGPIDLENISKGGLTSGNLARCALTGALYRPLQDGSRRMIHKGSDKLDWVICGGESGPHARPMHPDWARSLRDQCTFGGVPFLFKQWGSWAVEYDRDTDDPDWRRCPRDNQAGARYLNLEGGTGFHGDRVLFVRRVDKARAGRLLDGVTHDQFPKELMR